MFRSSRSYWPKALGRPVLGWVETWHSHKPYSSSTYWHIESGPRAQSKPKESGRAWRREL
jgi:hypothetical protein